MQTETKNKTVEELTEETDTLVKTVSEAQKRERDRRKKEAIEASRSDKTDE